MTMTDIIDAARTGRWLTRQRLRAYTLILLAGYAVIVALLAIGSPDGRSDAYGRPLGFDYSNIYAGGTYVLEGSPAAPFDPALQYRREQQIFGSETPFLGWHYPPFFLGVAALFALLPYAASLVAWQVSTFALYLTGIHGLLGASIRNQPLWWLGAVAFPGVFINMANGHNGFLTTGLLGLALFFLDRRRVLAGLLIAALVYKPQFALFLPLVLAVSGRWTTFLAAAAGVIVMIALATLAFGMETWRAFFGYAWFTQNIILEQGATGWHKIQSVFSWVRMWGGSISLAYAAQGALIAVMGIMLVVLWRSQADIRLKGAALAVASLLGTPYCLDYDMTVLAVAIALVVSTFRDKGFPPWSITLLSVIWALPLIARTFTQATFIPIGTIGMMVFVWAIWRWSTQTQIGATASS